METCRREDARHSVSKDSGEKWSLLVINNPKIPANPDSEAPIPHRQKHLPQKFFLCMGPLRKNLTTDYHHSDTPGLLSPSDLLENLFSILPKGISFWDLWNAPEKQAF